VDKLYPALHRGLFSEIRKNGCLFSQFAIGSRPNAYRFLTRNGLIAAMSLAAVVVEAPLRSGAMSTAHHANELGRQVFVVPANIDNLNFSGSHSLIRDGAVLVDHPDQVLEALGLSAAPAKQPELALPSAVGERILGVLTVEPLAAEFIVERTGLDTAEVMSELTMLEIDGRVMRDAGGYALRP
jgi:DNA processing protein